jgi:uncharacterized cupredoxin-like copper-binding protein
VFAGDNVFFLVNASQGTHDLTIGPLSSIQGTAWHKNNFLASSATVAPGQSAAFSVHGLKPGRYAFWCTIDDHAEEGMFGTISVK